TDGPGCLISSAVTSAEPIVQGSVGTSWNDGREGTFRRCTGKKGGAKNGAIRRSRLLSGAGGPQIRNSTDGSQKGVKNRSPSMWSVWRCVINRSTRGGLAPSRDIPKGLIPVPASRITSDPSESSTAMHDVWPP